MTRSFLLRARRSGHRSASCGPDYLSLAWPPPPLQSATNYPSPCPTFISLSTSLRPSLPASAPPRARAFPQNLGLFLTPINGSMRPFRLSNGLGCLTREAICVEKSLRKRLLRACESLKFVPALSAVRRLEGQSRSASTVARTFLIGSSGFTHNCFQRKLPIAATNNLRVTSQQG